MPEDTGLQLGNSPPRFGLADGSPSPDVAGCVEVGVRGVAALLAYEERLRGAVGLFAVTTLGAGAAGVARIDEHHRNARECGLVRHELPELREGTARVSGTVLGANRCPVADVGQLFQ